MDDNAISISVTEDERAFMTSEIEAGHYSDEHEILHAGLAVLEREARLRKLRRLIAEGDADFAAGRVHEFENAGDMTRYIIERSKTRK